MVSQEQKAKNKLICDVILIAQGFKIIVNYFIFFRGYFFGEGGGTLQQIVSPSRTMRSFTKKENQIGSEVSKILYLLIYLFIVIGPYRRTRSADK